MQEGEEQRDEGLPGVVVADAGWCGCHGWWRWDEEPPAEERGGGEVVVLWFLEVLTATYVALVPTQPIAGDRRGTKKLGQEIYALACVSWVPKGGAERPSAGEPRL